MSSLHPRHRSKSDIPSIAAKRKEGRIRRTNKRNRRQQPKGIIIVGSVVLVLFFVRLFLTRRPGQIQSNKTILGSSADKVDVLNHEPDDIKKKTSQLRVKGPKWENKMVNVHNNIPQYDSDIDPQISKFEESNWPHPIIHIVNTRFMQNQAHLPILALTRLKLFETICYSTMVHADVKRNKSLIWIIKTDPNLPRNILEKLINLLDPHDNFFLVSSLENFGIGHAPGAWRGGIEALEVLSHSENGIHTGNIDLLKAAQLMEKDRIILETRLDADDGLSTEYLSMVQKEALDIFLSEDEKEIWGSSLTNLGTDSFIGASDNDNKPKWFYWCIRNHAEWHPTLYAFEDKENNSNVDKLGHLNIVTKKKMCITPGLTVGFNKGTKYEEVPQYSHSVLYKKILAMGECIGESEEKGGEKCIALMESPGEPVLAIRSRTPTSAGMMNILVDFSKHKNMLSTDLQKKLWLHLQSSHFMINAKEVESIQQFINENLIDIARENLKGQCTNGHSCKLSSKEMLQRFIEIEEEKQVDTNNSHSLGFISFNMKLRANQKF